MLLGDISKRLVVSPDVWQLMEDQAVPNYPRDLLSKADEGTQQQQPRPAALGPLQEDNDDGMEVDEVGDGLQPGPGPGPLQPQAAARVKEEAG